MCSERGSGIQLPDDLQAIGTAIAVLREHFTEREEHRSVLVTRRDEAGEGRIAGVVTLSSRMPHSLRGYGARTRRRTEDDLRAGFDLTVSELMQDEPDCVDAEMSPAEVLQVMMWENAEMLLVARGERVVGVVRAIDLLQYIEEAWQTARDG